MEKILSSIKNIAFLPIYFILVSSSFLYGENAPVTMAGIVTNALPGAASVEIPVTVTGFNNIGKFTLTMTFDNTRVHFASAATNPALPGMTVVYTPPAGNTRGTIVFTWTGASNLSLTDGASLANLTFTYVTGTSILSWTYSYGAICQYLRYVGGTLTPLTDSPQYLFYKNGGISNRGAPITYAPLITVNAPGPFTLPITVNNFTGIGAFTLYLEYDPAIITYQNTYTKNAAFGTAFAVGIIAGEGGKMQIVIQWYGNSVTLDNGAALCTLNFTYPASNPNGATLTWYDVGPSCEYSDGQGDVLIDMPQSSYYHDGKVAPPQVGVTISPSANPVCANTSVIFTAIPVNGGTTPAFQWKVNGIYSGSNSSTYSCFPANNDLVTCVLTSNAAFVSGNPATSNAVVMNVNSLPSLVADFTADKLTPRKNDTVLFTDVSTGNPTGWSWSFDRSSVVFLNGTSSHSQNPQVQFTDGGLYTVTLVIDAGCFTNTRVKTGYIRVGIPGLWSGITSSSWNTLSNWDNYLVPGTTTDVTIPHSSPNWPVFDGDLTIGINCSSLTLSGITSRMTITGNLTLP